MFYGKSLDYRIFLNYAFAVGIILQLAEAEV